MCLGWTVFGDRLARLDELGKTKGLYLDDSRESHWTMVPDPDDRTKEVAVEQPAPLYTGTEYPRHSFHVVSTLINLVNSTHKELAKKFPGHAALIEASVKHTRVVDPDRDHTLIITVCNNWQVSSIPTEFVTAIKEHLHLEEDPQWFIQRESLINRLLILKRSVLDH